MTVNGESNLPGTYLGVVFEHKGKYYVNII